MPPSTTNALHAMAVYLPDLAAFFGAFLTGKNIEISKRAVKKLLHRHTNNKNYLQNVMRGGPRFKLDGTEVGEVQKEEKEHAKRSLDTAE